MKNKWFEYLPLFMVIVSIFSLGRPGLGGGIQYYIEKQSIEYSRVFVRNFSAIWFFIIPMVGFLVQKLDRHSIISKKRSKFLLIALSMINVVLWITFIPPRNDHIYPSLNWIARKTFFNIFISFAFVRGYAGQTKDLILLKALIRLPYKTEDTAVFEKAQSKCAILCYLGGLYVAVINFFFLGSFRPMYMICSLFAVLIGTLYYGRVLLI